MFGRRARKYKALYDEAYNLLNVTRKKKETAERRLQEQLGEVARVKSHLHLVQERSRAIASAKFEHKVVDHLMIAQASILRTELEILKNISTNSNFDTAELFDLILQHQKRVEEFHADLEEKLRDEKQQFRKMFEEVVGFLDGCDTGLGIQK